MILLDTNVISEPLRRAPYARVVAWIDAQPLETLHLSAVSVAELRAGVALASDGKRRAALHERLETLVLPMFVGRTPPFDVACTGAYADVLARARLAGSPVATADACIAAIALTNGFLVATRDIGPFRAAGLRVINPWES